MVFQRSNCISLFGIAVAFVIFFFCSTGIAQPPKATQVERRNQIGAPGLIINSKLPTARVN
ncbi:MAG: hypothetical protein RLY14_866, partial [Planctomycetota bacterium]